MEFSYTDKRITIIPSVEEHSLFRAAVHRRLLKAASGGLQLAHDDAVFLLWYIDSSHEDEQFNMNCTPAQITPFMEAIAAAQTDISAEETPLAQSIIAAISTALEGFVILQTKQIVPEFIPEHFE